MYLNQLAHVALRDWQVEFGQWWRVMLIMRGLLGANYSLFEEGWQSPDELLLIDVFHCDTGHLWGEESMNKEEDHGKLKEKKSDGDKQQKLGEPEIHFFF